jgi:hypothetical protein
MERKWCMDGCKYGMGSTGRNDIDSEEEGM